MFSNDRILTLDVGASKLVLGEFFVKKGASLVLTKYVVRTLDAGQADAVAPTMESLAGVVREMMAEGGIKAAPNGFTATLNGPVNSSRPTLSATLTAATASPTTSEPSEGAPRVRRV